MGGQINRSNQYRKPHQFLILFCPSIYCPPIYDFTKHKEYPRMAAYVQRHHGIKFENIDKNKLWFKMIKKKDDNTIKKELLQITKSRREKWDRSGIATAGFWSRWLLWSHPKMEDAKRYIENTFDVSIQNYT